MATDGKEIPSDAATSNGEQPHPSSMERLAAVLVSDGFASAAALVADETSTEDLKAAHDIIEMIVGACESGDREALERLAHVRDVFVGRADTKLEREARYVEVIEQLTRVERRQGWENEPSQDLPKFPLPKLLAFHDPKFANLKDADVRALLGQVERKGGRGSLGFMRAAAQLAVDADAFNLGARVVKGEHEIRQRALDRAHAELKKARGKPKV